MSQIHNDEVNSQTKFYRLGYFNLFLLPKDRTISDNPEVRIRRISIRYKNLSDK